MYSRRIWKERVGISIYTQTVPKNPPRIYTWLVKYTYKQQYELPHTRYLVDKYRPRFRPWALRIFKTVRAGPARPLPERWVGCDSLTSLTRSIHMWFCTRCWLRQWAPDIKKRQFSVHRVNIFDLFPTLIYLFCIGFRFGLTVELCFLTKLIIVVCADQDLFFLTYCFLTAGVNCCMHQLTIGKPFLLVQEILPISRS